MINTLLVCDNNDSVLGDFFGKCKVETEQLIASSGLEIQKIDISGNTAFDVAVPMAANSINSNPFLFVSYTHGSEDELLKSGTVSFLSTNSDGNVLKNSIAYCYACEAGKNFGKEICENGTLCFIGYKDIVAVQKFFGAEDAFIECAVCGIKVLLAGNTTGEAFTAIKEKHTEYIDDFYSRDMLTAMIFMQNRDALVMHGDPEQSLMEY